MDIHFCDLCGVRVTDVDLRGGHGIRKQYDVICATCLELGHGKEWLASHQRGKIAAVAPATQQPAVAALAATASNKQAPIITQARDRVQTFEDGDESPAVAPQVLAAEEPDDGTATSELMNEEVAKEVGKQANNQFAAAASTFSALASSPKKRDAAADVEEGSDRGEGLSDESTAAPILADDDKDHKATASGDAGESPFGFKDDHQDKQSQKDETLPVDREPLVNDKATGDKKKSSGSASFKKSSAGDKSSSTNNKSSTKNARSGKAPAKKVNKNKNILMMSALSIGILTMILLITVQALKKPRKEQQRIEIDLSENVKSAIKEAKFNATKALQPSGTLKDCLAARDQIQAIVPEITIFEKAATSQNPPWTDEQMGQYLENIGWADLNSFIITINQKIARLKAPGGGN